MKDLKLIILYGSRARETHSKDSDVDVAVLADHPVTLAAKTEVSERMAKRFSVSDEQIDVVDMWDAPPLLAHEVGETGTLLEGEQFDFIRFRVRAWKRYLDTAKFRRVREQSLKRYVKRTHS